MKTIILNGSPRKNQNTALMLKSAQKGAAAAGSDDYYKLTYADAEGNTVGQVSFAMENCFGFYIVLDDTAESWSVTTAEGERNYAAGDRVLITGETTVRPVA